MKRILFVGNTSWSMYNFRLGVFKLLRDNGFEILVAAPVDYTTVLIEREGFMFYPIVIDNKGTSLLNDGKLLLSLFRLYKSIDPYLIFHYTMKPNIYGTFAARLTGCSSVSVVTGAGYSFMRRNWLSFIVKQLLSISFRFAKQVWFLNQDDVDFFSRLGVIDPKKMGILPGEGVDTGYFDPGQQATSRRSTEFNFLFLGRILWDKGLGEYVEAARILKERNSHFLCNILGFLDVANPSAIPKETIDRWQAEGLINYLGATSNVKQFIMDADCVVLPSYREGIPRSLLEAACLKRPIIATDTVGCKDVVVDGSTGYLVKVKDSRDLADKMLQIMSLPLEERLEMGERGRRKMMDEFDQKIVVKKYLEVLNSNI